MVAIMMVSAERLKDGPWTNAYRGRQVVTAMFTHGMFAALQCFVSSSCLSDCAILIPEFVISTHPSWYPISLRLGQYRL